MTVQIKRIYAPSSDDDGQRILVDRLWPRGVRKDEAALSLWFKDIAPSAALRKWFNHEPAHWDAFRQRYRQELDDNSDAVETLRGLMAGGKVTLLYGAHDEQHNHALVLAEYLDRHSKG